MRQGGCSLEDTGEKTVAMPPCTLASTSASRMRNTLLLVEGLLDILIKDDENAVVWEWKVISTLFNPPPLHRVNNVL